MDKAIHKQPLISVVMCAFNGMPYIKEAVDCILNQTYKNWELIVSDDVSTDGTREWLNENFMDHPQIRLFFQPKNIGYVANKNFVHQHARGTYITQLDNDDRCSAERLDKQLRIAQSHPEIKIVGCGYRRINHNGLAYGQASTHGNMLIDSSFKGDYPFWFPSLLVHRTVFDQVGYFDEYFAGALGDDLYWTKRAHQRYPIYYFADILYEYRDNPNSITNQCSNLRKLIMPEVLRVLIGQMKEGKDWLSSRDFHSLSDLEKALLSNDVFMSEQYRVWAAKAVDKGNKRESADLLWRSIRHNVFNLSLYRTILYFLRNLFRK